MTRIALFNTGAMHEYRLYIYDAQDRLIAPAMVISADNNEAAGEQAEKNGMVIA